VLNAQEIEFYKGFEYKKTMIDVMDFDFGLFDESDMDLLAPSKILEPVEFFETPSEVVETKQPDLSSEEVTAADQLLDELLNYIEPSQETLETVDVVEDLSKNLEQDKVFEPLQPVLDLTPEEVAAPDQLLEELLKQPQVPDKDLSNVSTVITEEGKTVYILTLDSKLVTPETETLEALEALETSKTTSKRSKKVRSTPYDKKERKRKQDAQAAQKYRLKKKEEQGTLLAEEQSLVMKRNGLKSQVVELEAEVKTLKKLMVELGFLPSSFRFYGGLKKKK